MRQRPELRHDGHFHARFPLTHEHDDFVEAHYLAHDQQHKATYSTIALPDAIVWGDAREMLDNRCA